MNILLDSLDVNLIREYSDIGVLSGVTTNPTMAKRFDMNDDIEMIAKVREALGQGEIHVEAFGDTADEIVGSANAVLEKSKDSDLVFKIPFGEQGVKACSELARQGLKTNLHLVFSLNQSLLAASVGATYICMLAGRLDDTGQGHDAMEEVECVATAFRTNSSPTKLMVSSVRHPQHVSKAYMCGADAVTIPPNVLSQMFHHPLTHTAVAVFRDDIEAVKPLHAKTINTNLVLSRDATLQDCLSSMVVHKGGAVAISTSGGRLAGIFTAGDLKRLVQKNVGFSLDDGIEKYMNAKPISVDINETVSKARELLQEFNIDQLVVVDGGSVVGILDAREVT